MTPAAVIDALELAGVRLVIVDGRVVVRPGGDPVPPRLLRALERDELAVLSELRRQEDETPGAASSPDEEDPAEDLRTLLGIIDTARCWLEAVLPHASERVRDVLHPTVRMLDAATNPRLRAVVERGRGGTPGHPCASRRGGGAFTKPAKEDRPCWTQT